MMGQQSLLERTLVRWAKKHDYLVQPRQMHDELATEVQVKHDSGNLDPVFALVRKIFGTPRGDKRNNRELESDLQPQVSRAIYIPTGLIMYRAYELPTATNSMIDEQVVLRYGAKIPNWRLSNIPIAKRRRRMDSYFRIALENKDSAAPLCQDDVEVLDLKTILENALDNEPLASISPIVTACELRLDRNSPYFGKPKNGRTYMRLFEQWAKWIDNKYK